MALDTLVQWILILTVSLKHSEILYFVSFINHIHTILIMATYGNLKTKISLITIFLSYKENRHTRHIKTE